MNNYRPISLISHIYKIFTRIITNRIEKKLDFYETRVQAELRAGFGTNDHLLCLKAPIEKSVECNRSLALVFVDFQKAFDTIDMKAILAALDHCRIDHRYTRLIYNNYVNSTASIKLHKKTK